MCSLQSESKLVDMPAIIDYDACRYPRRQPVELAVSSRDKGPAATRLSLGHDGNAPRRIRVLAVDDHPIILAAIEHLLAAEEDLELVAQCRDGSQALRFVALHAP